MRRRVPKQRRHRPTSITSRKTIVEPWLTLLSLRKRQHKRQRRPQRWRTPQRIKRSQSVYRQSHRHRPRSPRSLHRRHPQCRRLFVSKAFKQLRSLRPLRMLRASSHRRSAKPSRTYQRRSQHRSSPCRSSPCHRSPHRRHLRRSAARKAMARLRWRIWTPARANNCRRSNSACTSGTTRLRSGS